MEKFMLLFSGSEVYQPDQSPESLEALTVKMMHWVMGLSEKGLHVASEKFQRTGKQFNGQAISNMPYGIENDIIGGCTIVLAKDINEATVIAQACPILESNATIEIRAIQSV